MFNSIFGMAVHNLKLNRHRSILAMLGIIVGILGVMIIGIVSTNGKKLIFDEIKTFGLQTIWIYRDNPDTSQIVTGGTGITWQDVQVLSKQLKHIKAISGVIENQIIVHDENQAVSARVQYVQPSFFGIENDSILSGRLWTQSEFEAARPFCVIDQELSEKLFGQNSPVGKSLLVGDLNCQIIGILAKKDRDILKSIGVGTQKSGRIVLPISIALNTFDIQDIDYIQLAAITTQDSDLAVAETLRWLNQLHYNQFKYTHLAMSQYIHSFNRISSIVSLMLGTAALMVGGIGIANVMTIATIERTKEIGIRKAVGATSQDIFKLFLMESVVITSIAGIIGVGIGCVLGIIGTLILPGSFLFPAEYIIWGVSVSILTGILSGLYPALKASNKSPVEALRYE